MLNHFQKIKISSFSNYLFKSASGDRQVQTVGLSQLFLKSTYHK